jgi:hypothetical protein
LVSLGATRVVLPVKRRIASAVFGPTPGSPIARYGSTRALSRVANELLRRALKGLGAAEELVELLYAKRYARITVQEFERFRRELSRRLEER